MNVIINSIDSLRWLAIMQCNGSLLSLVIISLQGSLQVLAVMLRIGSLSFIVIIGSRDSLSKPVGVVFDDTL